MTNNNNININNFLLIMKKNFFYAMMSALALTSAIGFTACSSNDDVVEEVNPTYDGNSVRTDFAFSVTKANAGTRMTAANVQESTSQNFLGIKEMFLLPFSAVPGTATETNAANFYLGELTTSDINTNVINRETATSSKVYSLTLPIQTNNFLFYGLASTSGTNFQKGSVTRSGLSVPTTSSPSGKVAIGNIKFSLNHIASKIEDEATDSTKFVNYLTNIAKAEDDTYGSWEETTTKAQTDGRYKALADMYSKFTATNMAPRSGSTEAVTRLVLDLYRSAFKINQESSVVEIKEIAAAICTAITTDANVTFNLNDSNTDPNLWTATLDGVTSNFPANLDLPMGAAQLVWDDEKFTYNHAPLNFGPSSDAMEVGKYRYPAELIYFDNSPLRATDTYTAADDYPKTAKAWDVLYQTTAWADTKVKPSTRAVAMTNNVNYGVALLQTNVKLGEKLATNDGFTDNMKAILGSSANQTNIDATQFTVTGLLIGGQPREVKWDMTNPNDEFKQVIYDHDIAFGTTNLSTNFFTANNYTIVLDNYANKNDGTEGAEEDQKKVRIALEIKNGNQDFYGINGLIPANSTFYLVGELDPQNPKTDYARPDYRATTTTYRVTKEDVQRVFMQDYKTIANIIIGETALQKAYSTIPDLRSTEVVFGLSVDMTWEKGVEFEMTLN